MPESTLPELPNHRGKPVTTKDPVTKAKTHMVIEDEIQRPKTGCESKVIVLQKVRYRDSQEVELRLAYYIIGKRPKMLGKWTWGQYVYCK